MPVKTYGNTTDENLVLTDNAALPNNTTAQSTAVYLGSRTIAPLRLKIYADTALSVAADKTFSIALKAGTNSTASGHTGPFWKNSSGWTQTGTTPASLYIISKPAGNDALYFPAGSLIAEYIIPSSMFPTQTYVCVEYVTTANLSAQKVTSIICL